MPDTTPPGAPVSYHRGLGLFSGTMAVIGGIIGSGIFLNPAIVASRVGTSSLTILAWVLGGVVAMLGAFIYGELAARVPRVGGGYAYLRDAYGPFPAFLYAWALLLIMATGAVAAVAFTFASYAAALFGLAEGTKPFVAGGAILFFTALNYIGVKPAAWTQNVLTVLKLTALALLIVAGLTVTPAAPAVLPPPVAAPTSVFLALATAFVPVLFSYGGWQQTNFIAGELVQPEKTLPRALVLGVTGVVITYLLANLAYLKVLGVAGLAASSAPAAQTMEYVLGPTGRKLISAGILASTFGFLDLVIMVSPRVYQAMAADGLFFASFAKLHPKYRTPVAAILVQGAWACLLLATKTYGVLLDWVTFADWIFFGSTAATLFVYRKRDKAPWTGFRLPGFPVTVLLFVAASIYVVVGSVLNSPKNALWGSLILLLGVPVYRFWSGRKAS